MYDTILVPTDGSKQAMKAAEHAIHLAEQVDGTVHALYVMDMGDADFVATPSDIAETRQRLEQKGKEYVEEVELAATEAGLECVTDVKSGMPEDEIMEYVDEHGIDLIVIGKRGRSDPDKPAFGSITWRVVGNANVPVYAV
jgi:nucleotide-binding universal stress UspA family protein